MEAEMRKSHGPTLRGTARAASAPGGDLGGGGEVAVRKRQPRPLRRLTYASSLKLWCSCLRSANAAWRVARTDEPALTKKRCSRAPKTLDGVTAFELAHLARSLSRADVCTQCSTASLMASTMFSHDGDSIFIVELPRHVYLER